MKLKYLGRFFATSHGKEAVDGIGAVLKKKKACLNTNKVKAIQNSEQFAKCVADKDKYIKITYKDEKALINFNRKSSTEATIPREISCQHTFALHIQTQRKHNY